MEAMLLSAMIMNVARRYDGKLYAFRHVDQRATESQVATDPIPLNLNKESIASKH